ncbi:glycosyltransferase [Helicobacter jaachi]|uniref:Glycosyltransferase n=1 Tax=Helicobacter jaachi TaxID=1677920 RepID=A0A4U8T993_9HELI|nr:glycosyltransferase [Helicobacter jaachi]TLD96174.1 glycosyltransferase [Helicobacter jaachi]
MKQEGKVSIIVPIYNVQDYLRECLDSIINQSHTNLEIILVNDGSTDESGAIAQDYARKDGRICYFEQANKGAAYARNVGLEKASGAYIYFIDPDDFFPNAYIIELLYTKANENRALICGGCFSEYRKGEIITQFGREFFGYTFAQEGFIAYRDWQFDFGFTRFIYKRSLLRDSGITFPHYKKYEDPVFFVKVMLAAQRFYALTDITYCYRVGHQRIEKWDKKAWNDQTRGLMDILIMAQNNHLPILYDLTYERVKVAAHRLNDVLLKEGRGLVQSFIILNNVLNFMRDKNQLDKTPLICNELGFEATFESINQAIMNNADLKKISQTAFGRVLIALGRIIIGGYMFLRQCVCIRIRPLKHEYKMVLFGWVVIDKKYSKREVQ